MKVSAYGVHLFTALGAALGLWAILLTFDGFYKEAIWVLGAAVFVDAIDGSLARFVDIKRTAPKIDGALMDNIIDFITWTVAPLVWIYATMQVPMWVLFICAISSAFGFSNIEAKTSDNYFLGFPSYWNIVVFYIFLLNLPVNFASAILLIFAITTFLPIKFIYPTRTSHLKILTLILGSIFALQLIALMILFQESPLYLIYSSFIFPMYYFSMSFYLNFKSVETT
ncbi:MAG: CDP-alcohol phosphatidyltransferase family protein [Candidatus Halalkalibacterium sp. M3_1C_030]